MLWVSLWFIQCLMRKASTDDMPSWRPVWEGLPTNVRGAIWQQPKRFKDTSSETFARHQLILESSGVRDSWWQQLSSHLVFPVLASDNSVDLEQEEDKSKRFQRQQLTKLKVDPDSVSKFRKNYKDSAVRLLHVTRTHKNFAFWNQRGICETWKTKTDNFELFSVY